MENIVGVWKIHRNHSSWFVCFWVEKTTFVGDYTVKMALQTVALTEHLNLILVATPKDVNTIMF